MQYQRALWVNRLLKEQLAVQTQGLSIEEIDEAQQSIQARMHEVLRQAEFPVLSQGSNINYSSTFSSSAGFGASGPGGNACKSKSIKIQSIPIYNNPRRIYKFENKNIL